MINKNLFFLLTILISLLASCNQNKKPVKATEIAQNTDSYLKTTPQSISDDIYCKVQIGNTKYTTSDCLFISSNSLKKEVITTIFEVSITDENVFEKYPLLIELTKNENLNSPKINLNTYNVKALFDYNKPSNAYFDFLGNTVDEETYKTAVATNILEDIKESFVIPSGASNTLVINSVKDVGEEEEDEFYITGRQLVSGNLNVSLFQISTEKNILLKINFSMYHDWSISKKIK